MNSSFAKDELLEQTAKKNSVSVEVLAKLMELEQEFSDFTIHGSKISFSRRLASIIDDAVSDQAGPRTDP